MDPVGRHASAFRICLHLPGKDQGPGHVAMLVTKFTDANQRAQREVQQTVNGFTSSQVRDANLSLDKLDRRPDQIPPGEPGQIA